MVTAGSEELLLRLNSRKGNVDMNNTELNYLYRDGDNYKKWGSVVFSGTPDNLEAFEDEFKACLDDSDYFVASQVGVPEVFLYTAGGFALSKNADHCFHEFDSFELTDKEPTDKEDRSIVEFFEAVKAASEQGWKVVDPTDVVTRDETKNPTLRQVDDISTGREHWQWFSDDQKSESQCFGSREEAEQAKEKRELEWNVRCHTPWWKYGAVNKTSYAKSIGYVGASPVIVRDGFVLSNSGMPWSDFCEKCRAGELDNPAVAHLHWEMLSDYGCLVSAEQDGSLVYTPLYNIFWNGSDASEVSDPWAGCDGTDEEAQCFVDAVNEVLKTEFTLDYFRRMVPRKSNTPAC